MLNVIDEYTCETLMIVVDRSINADKVVAVLDRLAVERGSSPAFPALRQRPTVRRLRNGCLVPLRRYQTVFIEPGSPWQNAWFESVNGRLRDEFLNGWPFDSLLGVQVLAEDCRIDCNCNRTHTADGEVFGSEDSHRVKGAVETSALVRALRPRDCSS